MESTERVDHAAAPDDDAPHLLVVDDDTRIRNLLKQYLTENGFRVTVAGNAGEARRKLAGLDFDLLVLDVMMPGETGVDLTKSLRAEKNVPILMLTALSETDSRISGLEAGADDYLPKPFDPRELILRINNILRRGGPATTPKVEQLVFGPYTFQIARRELKRGGEALKLTDREQEILAIFAARAGETIPRHELVGDDSEVGERTIDVQINRLRRKIERDPSNPVWLQTVRGIGYRLSVE
ncbi:response regulator transcription factor [Mesorhizobium sp. M7A.F.Ca.CA.001.09.2.1]|jgi:two-component system phosphate regulon response regulator OmpR|uniref:Transcriptional regulator n=8 Tax=Mesorhizobium TaxID=68287 RepID=A0A8E2WHF0_RHILI|nr:MULTISPECIES: response regulator transcription factor [Mesorhizobium]RUU63373.1 response regulator transcription factor [Mesorhizobium sp. M7A.T.Ca.TU.009.01.1.1]RUU86230.1 response regulator transcription factor [Mesorhizobium sp. M7A.T.Ca.TU.009.01.1.2]RUY50693.1 response regulator transcription factor [Mesorhizobium sp. M7A.F.Ca.CA.001.13.2.1]RUZ88326.1 response regulator transcription factor [Mesorhizobium sp. M7A.F.Ca.US.003.02.2.1]RVA50993.1 response regulator transcription factor [Me